jgi:hypothetical protein
MNSPVGLLLPEEDELVLLLKKRQELVSCHVFSMDSIVELIV